ncbi:MAG: M90 family metallopeptidase [Flavobacteriales bacterium]
MEQILLIAIILVVIYFALKISAKIPSKQTEIMEDSPVLNWDEILSEKVSFYKKLDEKDKTIFENRAQSFLNDIKITGVNCEVEELDKVLIAASAIIPVFHFPNWSYRNLDEVLLYPLPFNAHFSTEGEDTNIQGMVGNGFMNGKMILSRTSLRQGFQAELDKKNVGIHEFVHLIDGEDGQIDGIPKVLMTQQFVLPWMDLIYIKTKEIIAEKSDIRLYGATNEQEFLAVTSEYFFEHHTQFKKKHPELFELLSYFYSAK